MTSGTPAQAGAVARLAARHMDLHTLSPDCRGGCEAVVPAADYDRLAHRVEQLGAAVRSALIPLRYMVGNPSAWEDGYNPHASDVIGRSVTEIEAALSGVSP